MSLNSSRITVALAIGSFAAVGGLLLWLARRDDDQKTLATESLEQTDAQWGEDAFEEPPPSSYAFEPEPFSEGRVTARPSDRVVGFESFDDLDALSPEELGAAFLTGATDTGVEPAPRSTAEISGFQIYEPNDDEDEAEDADLA